MREIEKMSFAQVDKLFSVYPTDEAETTAPDIFDEYPQVEVKANFEGEDLAGVDFGSEEEITYHEEQKKKPYTKREPKIGDHFTGKSGDEMTYRKCESCGEAKWFKGNYKKCYPCNMKNK
jgi:hypothetical protein